MELSKNKWLNAFIFFVLVMLAVVAALAVMKFKPIADGSTTLKATLNLKK